MIEVYDDDLGECPHGKPREPVCLRCRRELIRWMTEVVSSVNRRPGARFGVIRGKWHDDDILEGR